MNYYVVTSVQVARAVCIWQHIILVYDLSPNSTWKTQSFCKIVMCQGDVINKFFKAFISREECEHIN